MVNKSMPLVSVIVPVYNVEKYLGECIDSITNQTYPNLEIILVNDGSTDSSGILCDRYAQQDQRIQVIHQVNKGLSGARNSGMDICTGQYVTFIDSDDLVDVSMIEIMLTQAVENQVDIVLCGTVTCDQDGNALERKMIDCSEIYRDELFRTFFTNEHYSVSAWGKLYARKIIDPIRFPDRKYHEDIFVAHQFLYQANSVMILNQAFYWYRLVQGSITHRAFQPKHLDAIEACIERSRFIEMHDKQWLDAANADLVYNCCKCAERMFQSAYRDAGHEKYIRGIVKKHLFVLLQNKRYSIFTKAFAITYSVSPSLMRRIYTMMRP